MSKPLILSVVACLAACGSESKSDQPTGQVVAQIGGEEITARELNLELQGASAPNPQALDAAQRQALQAIINRRLFAKAAQTEGLDDNPEVQLNQKRAGDMVLAQSLQQQITSKVPRPSREEAERYVAAHPSLFAQRKFYVVDQVQFSSADPEKIKMLQPLDTLDQVEGKLLESGVEYRRVPNSLDVSNLPAPIINRISEFGPGEIFIMPMQSGVTVNQIKETRVMPLSGEQAITYAQQLIFNERANKAIGDRLEALRKESGGVSYKKGYGPPNGASGAAPQQQSKTSS